VEYRALPSASQAQSERREGGVRWYKIPMPPGLRASRPASAALLRAQEKGERLRKQQSAHKQEARHSGERRASASTKEIVAHG